LAAVLAGDRMWEEKKKKDERGRKEG